LTGSGVFAVDWFRRLRLNLSYVQLGMVFVNFKPGGLKRFLLIVNFKPGGLKRFLLFVDSCVDV